MRVFITAQEIIVDNASYPIKEIAENSPHLPHARPRLRQPRLAHHELRPRLRQRRRPRHLRRHHRDHDRRRLRAERAHGRSRWGRSPATTTPAPAACRSRSRKTTSPPCSKSSSNTAAPCAKIPDSERVRLSQGRSRQSLGPRRSSSAEKHGYRNAQVTVLAPTGTISFLMDCDTTGIEPDIALVKYKLLAGGGMLKIVNQTVKPALRETRLQLRGDRAHHRPHRQARHDRGRHRRRRHHHLQRPEAGAHLPIFDCAFKPHKGERSLDYMRPHPHDGGGPAFPQRRDLQDRQPARKRHRRRDHEHLRRRLAARPEGDRHLSRQLQALRAA